MSLRTPLKIARNHGSAKQGAEHFWRQRVTGVANLILSIFLIWLLVVLAGRDHATVKVALSHPLVALPLLLLILSGMIHMRLGMQTIIEDYVHSEAARVTALMLNTFFTATVGAMSVYAVMKLSFGG